MHAAELDVPIPRPARLRVENPAPDTNFDPWMTWRMSWKCFAAALIIAGIGVSLARLDWAFSIAPFIFGALLGAFGLLGMLSGLLQANEEIRGHRFLVQYGVAALARVTKLNYDEDMIKVLLYEFTDNSGRQRKASCRTSGRGRMLRDLVVGQEFDVLYAPRNSRNCVPYAIALYEVADN